MSWSRRHRLASEEALLRGKNVLGERKLKKFLNKLLELIKKGEEINYKLSEVFIELMGVLPVSVQLRYKKLFERAQNGLDQSLGKLYNKNNQIKISHNARDDVTTSSYTKRRNGF